MEKKQTRKFRINRFPICALIHFAAAERVGFDTDQAMAIGQAAAIFYAAAKFGYFRNRGKKGVSHTANTKDKPTEIIKFGERYFYAKEHKGKLFPTMSNQLITEEDFLKTLRSKLTDEEIKAILWYVREYIKQFPQSALYRPYNIYVRIRDEWRTEEFWNSVVEQYRQQCNRRAA